MERGSHTGSILDLVLLVVVPLSWVAVFALPETVRLKYVNTHSDIDLTAFYLSHFVHFRPRHLLINFFGYISSVVAGYLIAGLGDQRSEYRGALIVALTVLPVVLSALNTLILRAGMSYGASGIVMGTVGLLPIFIFAYLARVPTLGVGTSDAPVAFFLTIGIASFNAPLADAGLVLMTLALALAGIYLLYMDIQITAVRVLPREHLMLLLLGLLLSLGFPAVAFPTNPTIQSGTLNLLTHLFGYAILFMAAYLAPGIGTVPELKQTAAIEEN